eukprot:8878834-Heterocapsa_arctica.AAC.1
MEPARKRARISPTPEGPPARVVQPAVAAPNDKKIKKSTVMKGSLSTQAAAPVSRKQQSRLKHSS